MKQKKYIAVLLCIAFIFSITAFPGSAAKNSSDEVLPSTWAAVDGLGRTLSSSEDVGNKKDDKTVAMFYWTWHYPWTADMEPITTGSVLDFFPEANNDWDHPAWGNYIDGRPYFWDEPLYGFYSNLDEYVVRKHAELLADADIDVVFFDTTNETNCFPDAVATLLKVWSEAKADGVDVPKISFIFNFFNQENTRTQLHYVYDNLYSTGLYNDFYFIWEGKPLLMADSAALDLTDKKDREIFNYFNFRNNEATYFLDDTSFMEDKWGWCSEYEQTLFGKKLFGGVEQICVSVAQNANEDGLSAMNNPLGTVQGRGYAKGDYSYSYTYAGENITVDMNTPNAHYYGLNFQQQWDYAIEHDPDVVFVTGFNEWIAGRFKEWMGTECAFPDQFNPEYSRDIEPSTGELKDYYYYQLVENVRRFKGADVLPETDAEKTIDITGDIKQWNDVLPEYNHYSGGKHRDYNGWKGYHYKNDTFRNDIVNAKVAYDQNNVYFYVKTKGALTDFTDENWMRLFLDTDSTGLSPNWEGFEYVINRNGVDANKMTVEKSTGGNEFETVCSVDFTVKCNILQLEIPREALGLTDNEILFGFKWSDNMQEFDILDFYQNGDVAPGGRFTFVFDSTAEGDSTQDTSDFSEFFDIISDLFKKPFVNFRKIVNYIF